ncbi:MAG: hypothetical protein OXC72_06210 [Roseovarius sp.]|nr:hypothetical protein [Roseovarius sp.]
MCVIAIVDADSFTVLARRGSQGDELFLKWIKRGSGILAIPNTGQYFKELQTNHGVMELIRRYDQGGQLWKISKKQLIHSDSQIKKKNPQSNDTHILSLALASDAEVLCSNDGDLREDFQNKNILSGKGKQRRLLYPYEGTRKQRREFLNRQRCPSRKDI